MAAIRKTFTDASGDHRTFDVTEVDIQAMERLLGSAMQSGSFRMAIGEAIGHGRRQLLLRILGGSPASDFVDGVGGYDAPIRGVCAGTRYLNIK